MAHPNLPQVSALELLEDDTAQQLADEAPPQTVMILRPSPPAPPLGRKPDWVPPTQLLRHQRSAS